MYFEKLSELDKQRITNFITYNTDKTPNSLQKILKPWDTAKSKYLSKLFKDNLIIEEPITFEEDFHEITDKIDNYIFDDDRCSNFIDEIEKVYYERYNEIGEYSSAAAEEYRFIRNALFCYVTLAKNSICFENNSYSPYFIPELTIKDKKYKIQNGMKPMKIISKIAKEYNVGLTPDENGISDLEYFRRAHSRCLNTKALSGNLCLSIHPLDFMTMSDNDCGWSSCMSWTECGDYRQGTIEMMNSPNVVVAYLTSDSPYYWDYYDDDEKCWNSKKWRCLFIVDENFIVSVKSYPYENDNLTKTVIKKLRELSGWGEGTISPFKHREDNYIDNKKVYLRFYTCNMYNDFGTCNHYITLNPQAPENAFSNTDTDLYDYSGVSECMVCGETMSIDHTSEIVCQECDPYEVCDLCNERITDESNVTLDGAHLCDYCYGERTVYCDLHRDYCLEENAISIALSKSNDKEVGVRSWENREISIYEPTITEDTELWSQYFNIAEPRFLENSSHYFVCPKDCTPAGLELFGLYNEEQLQKYMNGN